MCEVTAEFPTILNGNLTEPVPPPIPLSMDKNIDQSGIRTHANDVDCDLNAAP